MTIEEMKARKIEQGYSNETIANLSGAALGTVQADGLHLKPPKKIIGIADGKYTMPPDELFFDDEISDMFDEL